MSMIVPIIGKWLVIGEAMVTHPIKTKPKEKEKWKKKLEISHLFITHVWIDKSRIWIQVINVFYLNEWA